MNTLSGQIRQSIALIITFGIILTMLCLYFFVYVDHKEEYVNARNFKILARITHNLNTKLEEFTSNHITVNIIGPRLTKCGYFELRDSTAQLNCLRRLAREIKDFTIEKVSIAKHQTRKDTFLIEKRLNEWRIVFKDSIHLTRGFQVVSSLSVGEFVEPLLQAGILADYVILQRGSTKDINVIYATSQLGVADSVGKTLYKNQNKIATIELNGATYLSFNYPFTFGGIPCLLAGLQKQEHYQAETRSLARPLLYTLVLITLLLLLSLPMIKVIFISKNERLNKTDIIWCGLSLLVGCFVCTIIFIGIDVDKSKLYSDVGLDTLSLQLEDRFTKEIEQAYHTLVQADSVFGKAKKDYKPGDPYDAAICTVLVCDPVKYGKVNVHWSNKDAWQRYKWTNDKLTAKINVSDRAYYRNIKEGKAWTNPFDEHGKSKYVLESILSWTDLEKKAVVSIRSNTDSTDMLVVGFTKKLRSVIEPILPPSYKFCIADLHGNVWFHSDPNRNLNENIFDELQVSANLRDQFYKPPQEGVLTYENREHALKIIVMKYFPLFLVTMKDKTSDEQSKSYTQEITFALLGLQLTMVFATIGLIRLTHRRAIKRLSLDWLKPDESKAEQYLKIGLLSIVFIMLFITLFLVDTLMPLEEIFLLITVPLCILPPCFLCLNIPTSRNYYKKPSAAVFACTVSAVIFIDLFCWIPWSSHFQNWSTIVVCQALMLLSYPILKHKFLPDKAIAEQVHSSVKLKGVFYIYVPAIFTLLILIGVLPTVVFFQHAFNYERTIHAMATQIEFVRQFYRNDGARKDVLQDVYLVDIKEMPALPSAFKCKTPLEEDNAFTNFSTFASIVTRKQPLTFLHHDSLQSKTLLVPIGDGKWCWNWERQSQRLDFISKQPDPNIRSGGFTTIVNRFPFDRTIVWIAGIGAMIYLIFLLCFLCRRIFIFDVNENLIQADQDLLLQPMKLDDQKQKEFKKNTATGPGDKSEIKAPSGIFLNHLFLIGLPFFDKEHYRNKLAPPDEVKSLSIDMGSDLDAYTKAKLSPDAEGDGYRVVIIDHFEYDLANLKTNLTKLEVLEKMFQFPNTRVIVFSTVHLVQLFEACPDMDPNVKTRWHSVLSNFYKIICPLQRTSISPLKKEETPYPDERKKNAYEFIEGECNHGLYLQNLKPVLYNLVDTIDDLTIPELVIKIKSLAYNYYVSLWQSCDLEEQYLMYDLAEDGLVNAKNAEAITRLLYKGIFIRYNALSLMNASFRDFVLSHINPVEALILREKVSKHGSWNRMRVALFFLLAGVALFLLYSQQGLSNQLMGFLTAITAALPLVFKMVESFSKALPKKTS